MFHDIGWVAILEDGTHIREGECPYLDVVKLPLAEFQLQSHGIVLVRIHLDVGKQLLYRKRTTMTAQGDIAKRVWISGWRKKGTDLQCLVLLHADGSVELFDETTCPIQLFAQELAEDRV